MTLTAAVAQSEALDGREAGAAAARQALDRLNGAQPVLALVAVSHDYPLQHVLAGLRTGLGDVPVLGFSTAAGLTSAGYAEDNPASPTLVMPGPGLNGMIEAGAGAQARTDLWAPSERLSLHRRSVGVALLAGENLHVKANWWPDLWGNDPAGEQPAPAGSPGPAVHRMLQDLQPGPGSILLCVGDGPGGSADPFSQLSTGLLEKPLAGSASAVSAPASRPIQIAGCLTEGTGGRNRDTQIGGLQSGSGGLAAALCAGDILLGTGASHGWQPIGTYFRVTETRDRWIKALDGLPAAEMYARLFGRTPEEWRRPPLRELVRLYPLGLESEGVDLPCTRACPYLVRTPQFIEPDGSLRMLVSVPQDSAAHLLVGSVEACLEAAREAAHQAVASLSQIAPEARPVLALIWADVSWLRLFESKPGLEFESVRSVLGSQVPILAGYTSGQVICPSPTSRPELLNQHIQVLLFAEPTL
jgi:hypothetical protein